MKTTFLGFFIFTVVVHLIFSWTPHLAESLYGNGFYTYLSRPFGDLLGRLLPIPGIYLVTFIILLLSNWVLIRKVRTHGLLKGLLRGFLVVLPAIYIYFYWIWGFNYLRPTISERLNLGKLQPTQSWIHSQLDSQVTILNTYRLRLNDLYADRNAITDISVDIQEIDESTRQVLKQFDYKVSGKADTS